MNVTTNKTDQSNYFVHFVLFDFLIRFDFCCRQFLTRLQAVIKPPTLRLLNQWEQKFLQYPMKLYYEIVHIRKQ